MKAFKYLLTALLFVPLAANAVVEVSPGKFCIGNDADLAAARAQAELEDDQFANWEVSFLFKKSATPYQFDEGVSFDGLIIRGGYSGTFCETWEGDPASTMIQFRPGTTTLWVSNKFRMEGVTAFGGQLSIVVDAGDDSVVPVDIKSNVFRMTQTPSDFQEPSSSLLISRAYFSGARNIDMTIAGNLVEVLQPVLDPIGWCAVDIDMSGDVGPSTLKFVNNTIVKSQSYGVCFRDLGTASVVANNIVRDASQGSIVDLTPSSPASVLVYEDNNLEEPHALPGLTSEISTTSFDPQFVDPVLPITDYHLQGTSPLLNTGSNAALPHLLEYDASGQPRKNVGLLLDVGAYESTIDDSNTVIRVTNNADSGPGSLRAAIVDANDLDNLHQTIRFDYNSGPANCAVTSLVTPLPDITDSLTIDGYNGPPDSLVSATPNTAERGFNAALCVRLASNGANHAFRVPAGAAGAGVQLKIEGLQLLGFANAILLEGGSNHVLTGNAFAPIGGQPNTTSVTVGQAVSGTRIGGNSLAERNLISSNSSLAAIRVAGTGTYVIDNLIGLGSSGTVQNGLNNGRGVILEGSGNFVLGNTISDSELQAVVVTGDANIVNANNIGVTDGGHCAPAPCTPAAPNGQGVVIFGDGNKLHGNWIAFNESSGIGIGSNASGNSLLNNRIEDNGSLGIDLGNNSMPAYPQVADINEPLNQPNEGMNFPLVIAASGPPREPNGAASGQVQGQLHSKNGTYTVQLFAVDACDDSGYGEGQEKIGETQVTIGNHVPPLMPGALGQDGSASFTVPVQARADLIGRFVTATARRDSTGSTSEFSQCFEFTQVNSAPEFDHQTLVFPNNGPVGTTRSILAQDDGLPSTPGKLIFSIEGPADPAFALSSDGTVTQTIAQPFALEASYQMAVKVTDGEHSVTKDITIQSEDLFRDGFED